MSKSAAVFNKKKFINDVTETVRHMYRKQLKEASQQEIFQAVSYVVKDVVIDDWLATQQAFDDQDPKIVYYMSMEFLMGRALGNNLINMTAYKEVKEALDEMGIDLNVVEDQEPDAALGNGGLGRLAACFLDSIANLGLNGDGVGLNYHLGLFRQVFENGRQKEVPDYWIGKDSWLIPTDVSYKIDFADFSVTSRMYDINVYGERTTNKLHLFDIDTVNEAIVNKSGIDFDKDDIKENLTLFLYPDDSDEKGRMLRIYQQYFMVSNGAKLIIDECKKKGSNLHDLYNYAVIQINDTHPTMVIPELIRLLMEEGIDIDEAIEIVSKTCAYTNHTILAEALEKWPISFLKEVVPQLVPIIEVLDDKVRRRFDDESVVIIDKNDTVHMAHIDIHYGFSVNGVAALHTEILEKSELNNFYKIYPEKFNNKTNGITFRRWLLHCNPELTDQLTEWIGDGYKKDAEELKKLEKYLSDKDALDTLLKIKTDNKADFADYIKRTQNITLNPNSIFDIQVKRLHEYKRQQLNALFVIHKYLEIKKGNIPETPITVIFGAKAAPAYIIAKDIIHLILCLQEIINNDPEVNKYLNVVMVENYNVTMAERLIPACDISEQISLASKEASGTGNMKFMLNGAITLGTEDGANVEIHQFVGDDNIYIFGAESDEVIAHYANSDYVSRDYYEKNPALKEAVDFITGDAMLKIGDETQLNRLKNELLSKDWFMTFLDFDSYVETKEKAYADFNDREAWAKKMLVNISQAGFFSSDRTIAQYNEDIWKL